MCGIIPSRWNVAAANQTEKNEGGKAKLFSSIYSEPPSHRQDARRTLYRAFFSGPREGFDWYIPFDGKIVYKFVTARVPPTSDCLDRFAS
jgi:hypothetical protein